VNATTSPTTTLTPSSLLNNSNNNNNNMLTKALITLQTNNNANVYQSALLTANKIFTNIITHVSIDCCIVNCCWLVANCVIFCVLFICSFFMVTKPPLHHVVSFDIFQLFPSIFGGINLHNIRILYINLLISQWKKSIVVLTCPIQHLHVD
jgi:uncharacterized membrane protein